MKHTIKTTSYILAILIIASLSIQFITHQIDEVRYPPMGGMVDVGGYKLHIKEQGAEHHGPTVVLDIGICGNMLYWSSVQPEIAKFARVVSYDRAGLGWSDSSPKARTSENMVEELHTLLHNANIPGPYILVGHSFAGINARIFANKYPAEVAGVVLVDSSHEDQVSKLPTQTDFFSVALANPFYHPALIFASQIGIARLYQHLTYDHKLGESVRNMIIAKNNTSKFMRSCISEWAAFAQNLDYVKHTGQNLGDLPLIVITAGMKPNPEGCSQRGLANGSCEYAYSVWQQLQQELMHKSSKGKQVIAEQSGHVIPVDQPTVIIHSIKQMLKSL